MAFTGRGTSTTASSWAWAHGPGGATATAGAAIGSSRLAAVAIAAAAVPRRRVDIQAVVPRPGQRLPVPAEHGLAQVMQQCSAPAYRAQPGPLLHVPRLRTQFQAEADLVAAADLAVVAAAADMEAAVERDSL
jgi:hypothetical protein